MTQLTPLEKKILQVLEDGDFHSGSQLSEEFAVSRTAVWKAVRSLIHHHSVSIESRKGLGYRLAHVSKLLNQRKLTAHFNACNCHFVCLDEIDSTNLHAMTLVQEGCWPVVVLAERQVLGRGRRGRSWLSPFAGGVWLSFGFRLKQAVTALKAYSLVVAVITCEVLRAQFEKDFCIKWPNDLYFQDKKLGGILIEISGDPDSDVCVVVGIGINVDMQACASEAVGQPYTDLYSVTGSPVDRHPLIISIVEALLNSLERINEEFFASYRSKWNELDLLLGKSVRVNYGSQELDGVAMGVTSEGELMVQLETGDSFSLSSGEVSVRVSPTTSGLLQ
ncbi:MAG: biotin--[acetyl-CoA-carboxylase] ligase [Pseudomonadales bacterium]|nr:biotin--[acetyl-CoA-carboxylase] ligase [Pseudomonadales bacterium]